jgi:hypothetical protein
MFKIRNTRTRKHSKAQSLVEFALILPVFLLVLTGIIEFGYAWFTWSAVSEVARMGVRYAITGQYDIKYCADAGAAYGYATDDLLDDSTDCIVPEKKSDGTLVSDYELKTALMQDWARRPSTRDAAIAGGSTGLLLSMAPAVSGDYLEFIKHPFPVKVGGVDNFQDTYRGDPTANGYFNISMCSNRAGVLVDSLNAHYYNDLGTNDSRYLGICTTDIGTVAAPNQVFTDDAGGPGDRVRITVTYNHPLIVPFFNAIWPHLKISASQDAIVEKFRTSRLAGLSQGISVLDADTKTFTATLSPTPSYTPTNTSTPTSTYTSTVTPTPCPDSKGTGLLGEYYAYEGTNRNAFTWSYRVFSYIDPVVNFYWDTTSRDLSVPVDDFHARWTGKIYAPYPGDYTFYTKSDDGTRVWISSTRSGTDMTDADRVINSWTDQSGDTVRSGTKTLGCGAYNIRIDYYERAGGALMRLGWYNANLERDNAAAVYDGKSSTFNPIPVKYLVPPTGPLPQTTPTPTATFTRTRTNTFTNTAYMTRTRTFTNTPVTPTNTRTKTFTNTPVTPTNTSSNTPVWTATRTFTKTPVCVKTQSLDLGGKCLQTAVP